MRPWSHLFFQPQSIPLIDQRRYEIPSRTLTVLLTIETERLDGVRGDRSLFHLE